MEQVGVTLEEQEWLWRVLGGLLLLGQLDFAGATRRRT
jgi:hypothetical protein